MSLAEMVATLPLNLHKSINTNGLLRQHWPKGADLRGLTQDECDNVALRLNTGPRKTLQWQSPARTLGARFVATTG